MLNSFRFHVIKLFLELLGVVSFNEVFVHLFYSVAQLRRFVDLGKGDL